MSPRRCTHLPPARSNFRIAGRKEDDEDLSCHSDQGRLLPRTGPNEFSHDPKGSMKQIVGAVGPTEAGRLVTEAYNYEILSNRMSRMEAEPVGIRRTEKRICSSKPSNA